jgi:hypothetical protein
MDSDNKIQGARGHPSSPCLAVRWPRHVGGRVPDWHLHATTSYRCPGYTYSIGYSVSLYSDHRWQLPLLAVDISRGVFPLMISLSFGYTSFYQSLANHGSFAPSFQSLNRRDQSRQRDCSRSPRQGSHRFQGNLSSRTCKGRVGHLQLEHSGRLSPTSPRPARLAKCQYDVIGRDRIPSYHECVVDIGSRKRIKHEVIGKEHQAALTL